MPNWLYLRYACEMNKASSGPLQSEDLYENQMDWSKEFKLWISFQNSFNFLLKLKTYSMV